MLFNNKEKDESIAVIDIGSGSVGAGIVSLAKNQPPKIVYSTRSPIIFQEKLDFEMFRRSMFSSLGSVLSELTSDGVKELHEAGVQDKKINSVFITLASPWYTAKTKTVVLKKGAPEVFTEKFVSDIIQNEVRKIEKGSTLDSLELVEHQIIDIKLNGYTLAKPYGKKAREIEITLFMSLISKNLLEEATDVVKQFFNTDDINFHSFALSSYSFIRDHFEEANDYIIIDVSSEMTDIFVADDGKLTNSTSFPFGTRSIIRMMTSQFGISEQESRTVLRMLEDGDLHPDETSKVNDLLGSAGKEWKKLFDSALVEAVGESHPQKAFVISESHFENIIKSFLGTVGEGEGGLPAGEAGDTESFKITEKEIILIRPVFFKNFIDMKGGSDAFIASEAYYADKLSRQIK